MKNQKQAYLFAAIAVFFWSTVASAFKIALRYISIAELLLISSFTSLLTLCLILVFSGQKPGLKNLTLRDYKISLLLGLLNPFLYYLILFRAYDLLPAQQAQPLNMIWGIVIVLMAIPFLKQPLTLRDLAAVVVSFLGVVIISTRGNFSLLAIHSPLGVALALGSSVIWSAYWLLNARDSLDPLRRLMLNFFFGFTAVLAYTLIFSSIRIPDIRGVAGALYVGVFEMGLTFHLWNRAMKLSVSAARISILIYIAPFISLIFIHLIVGEQIHFSAIIGLCLIVAGILVQKLKKKRMAEK